MKIRSRCEGNIIVALDLYIIYFLYIFKSNNNQKHATFRNEKYATKNIPFSRLYRKSKRTFSIGNIL